MIGKNHNFSNYINSVNQNSGNECKAINNNLISLNINLVRKNLVNKYKNNDIFNYNILKIERYIKKCKKENYLLEEIFKLNLLEEYVEKYYFDFFKKDDFSTHSEYSKIFSKPTFRKILFNEIFLDSQIKKSKLKLKEISHITNYRYDYSKSHKQYNDNDKDKDKCYNKDNSNYNNDNKCNDKMQIFFNTSKISSFYLKKYLDGNSSINDNDNKNRIFESDKSIKKCPSIDNEGEYITFLNELEILNKFDSISSFNCNSLNFCLELKNKIHKDLNTCSEFNPKSNFNENGKIFKYVNLDESLKLIVENLQQIILKSNNKKINNRNYKIKLNYNEMKTTDYNIKKEYNYLRTHQSTIKQIISKENQAVLFNNINEKSNKIIILKESMKSSDYLNNYIFKQFQNKHHILNQEQKQIKMSTIKSDKGININNVNNIEKEQRKRNRCVRSNCELKNKLIELPKNERVDKIKAIKGTKKINSFNTNYYSLINTKKLDFNFNYTLNNINNTNIKNSNKLKTKESTSNYKDLNSDRIDNTRYFKTMDKNYDHLNDYTTNNNNESSIFKTLMSINTTNTSIKNNDNFSFMTKNCMNLNLNMISNMNFNENEKISTSKVKCKVKNQFIGNVKSKNIHFSNLGGDLNIILRNNFNLSNLLNNRKLKDCSKFEYNKHKKSLKSELKSSNINTLNTNVLYEDKNKDSFFMEKANLNKNNMYNFRDEMRLTNSNQTENNTNANANANEKVNANANSNYYVNDQIVTNKIMKTQSKKQNSNNNINTGIKEYLKKIFQNSYKNVVKKK